MRFHGTVELEGKTATGVEVSRDVVESLGPSKRPAVRVTINDYTYRSSVEPMGGPFLTRHRTPRGDGPAGLRRGP